MEEKIFQKKRLSQARKAENLFDFFAMLPIGYSMSFENLWGIFKSGWVGEDYSSTAMTRSEGDATFAPSTSQIKVLSSTKTKICGTSTIGRAVYALGNALFWVCHIATFGFIRRPVRENADTSHALTKEELKFLQNYSLSDDASTASDANMLNELIDIAKKNPGKVFQSIQNHTQKEFLHLAVKSRNIEVQSGALELLKILAEHNKQNMYLLLKELDGDQHSVVWRALTHAVDPLQQAWLELLTNLVTDRANASRVYNLLMADSGSSDLGASTELCDFLMTFRNKCVLQQLLQLIQKLCKEAPSLGLDVLAVQPTGYPTLLHCLSHSIDLTQDPIWFKNFQQALLETDVEHTKDFDALRNKKDADYRTIDDLLGL
ncbi:MAG: hypothetical protein LBP65_00930 [Puniceicoccales bacterium]|nr:hypothetical protein [Puniceicoccales bacterium]